ncbi:MAG: TonB-dependent receptor, partial [Prevotella sp.]|nr:TonB-dependent receptor [Prevotella sp.]
MYKRLIMIVTLFLVIANVGWAQEQLDTTLQMKEVIVTSKLTYREVIPSQKLSGEQLQGLSALSVADAMRYFSGVQLKDYGGVGGVKTVDVRSMGTNHLGVSYDGIVLGNAQNGQIDLGQFSLDNVDEIALYNGQKSAIFQSASDFASASSVYIRTRLPQFEDGKRQNWKAKVKYGASDLLRLSTLYEQRLGNDLRLSVNAEVLTASGKYRFRYLRKNLDGTTAWDTTAVRENGDIHAERVEANLHGVLNQGTWQLKGYLYNSQRGIPGAIVNNVWRRGERQGDLNTFVQGQYQRSIGNVFSTKWLAKYAFYRTHYVNRDSTILPVDHVYKQQEVFFSSANVVEILPNWSASLSYDLRWNKLHADTYNFAFPQRFTHALSVATAIDYRHLKMQGSLVGTLVNDKQRPAGTKRHSTLSKLTPALFICVYPLRQARWLSMRAFAKQSFRMPTFNDLYYTDFGNANLKPEKATQYDVGIVLSKHFASGIITHVGLQADAYYNKVKDKIIAYPKGQQFRWTMLNLGEVDIRGIDVMAESSFRLSPSYAQHPVVGTIRCQYTHQRSIDVTDASKPFYRHQIPYIPRHSGSAI